MTRIVTDSNGRKFRLQDPVPLTSAPERIRLATESKPWKNYWRMLGTVLLAFILIDLGIVMLIYGPLEGDWFFTFLGAFCSFLALPFLILLHRPKMVHVRLATPDPNGRNYHPLPEGGSLYTTQKTVFQRFITRDDSVLDLPPLRQVWGVFGLILLLGIIFSIPLVLSFISGEEALIGGVYLLSFIPVMILAIAAFSIPVFAWWATSSKYIGLPTRRRDGEAWLIAGMASALPALIINSWIFPALLPSFLSESAQMFLLLTVSAPFGEEIFKMIAVCLFLPSIKNARKGFQIGFTVGLGFALIENLTYILGITFGPAGAIGLTLTTLVRGIGSIPGHALWTGITGYGIGCFAEKTDVDKRMLWLLRRLSVSTVDFAENIGFDVDGDGDKSGFDDQRQSLEEVLASDDIEYHPWQIIDQNTGDVIDPYSLPETNEKTVNSHDLYNIGEEHGFRIMPPRSVFICLCLAIFGHAFWNGSSYLITDFAELIGLGLVGAALVGIAWIIFLICTVLFLVGMILKGVRSLPS